MEETYDLARENVTSDWRELAAQPRFADAVIISTQDAMHVEPVVAFAQQGYAILLEKPMAPTLAGCQAIVQAVQENGNLFAVCHVVRYTAYTQAFKQLVDSGVLGDIVSIQHLEPLGFWHQAHSFVRGNWRNEMNPRSCCWPNPAMTWIGSTISLASTASRSRRLGRCAISAALKSRRPPEKRCAVWSAPTSPTAPIRRCVFTWAACPTALPAGRSMC
jgi:hypothetical protein